MASLIALLGLPGPRFIVSINSGGIVANFDSSCPGLPPRPLTRVVCWLDCVTTFPLNNRLDPRTAGVRSTFTSLDLLLDGEPACVEVVSLVLSVAQLSPLVLERPR